MVRHVIDLCSKIWWQFILSLEKTDRFDYHGELNKKTDHLFQESSVKQLLSNPSFMLSWSDLLILVTPRSVVGKSSAHNPHDNMTVLLCPYTPFTVKLLFEYECFMC